MAKNASNIFDPNRFKVDSGGQLDFSVDGQQFKKDDIQVRNEDPAQSYWQDEAPEAEYDDYYSDYSYNVPVADDTEPVVPEAKPQPSYIPRYNPAYEEAEYNLSDYLDTEEHENYLAPRMNFPIKTEQREGFDPDFISELENISSTMADSSRSKEYFDELDKDSNELKEETQQEEAQQEETNQEEAQKEKANQEEAQQEEAQQEEAPKDDKETQNKRSRARFTLPTDAADLQRKSSEEAVNSKALSSIFMGSDNQYDARPSQVDQSEQRPQEAFSQQQQKSSDSYFNSVRLPAYEDIEAYDRHPVFVDKDTMPSDINDNRFWSELPENWESLDNRSKEAFINRRMLRQSRDFDKISNDGSGMAWVALTPKEQELADYLEGLKQGTDIDPESIEFRSKQEDLLRGIKFARSYYHNAYINIEGANVVQTKFGRKITWASDSVEMAYRSIANVCGLGEEAIDGQTGTIKDLRLLNQIIMLSTGMCPDRANKLFDKSLDAPVYKSMITRAAQCIAESMRVYGHPFGWTRYHVDTNPLNCRFPIGVVTNEMANKLYAGLGFESAEELIEICEADHRNIVSEQLAEFVRNNPDQMSMKIVLEDMTRMLCAVDGKDPEMYGVPKIENKASLCDMFEQAKEIKDTTIDPEIADKIVEDRANRIKQVENRRANLEKHKEAALSRGGIEGEIVDPNTGEINDVVLYSAGAQVAKTVMNVYRTTHLALNIPLAVTSVAEKGINNLEVGVADRMLFGGDNYKKDYSPSRSMYQTAYNSKPFVEGLIMAKTLVDSGGMSMLQLYLEDGKPLTKASVKAWIANNTPRFSSQKLQSINDAMSKIPDLMMTGDMMFKKSDTKRFIQSFMAVSMIEGGPKAQQINDMLQNDPQDLIRQMFLTPEGRQALVMSTNLNVKRISPFVELLKVQMRKHGGLDLLSALLFDNSFITFTMKQAELLMPFSNTITFLTTNGFLKAREMMGKDSYVDVVVSENRLGGELDFNNAMKLCLAYDVAKFGKNATIVAIAFILYNMGDEPDNEEKKLLPWEWKINIPWTGEKLPLLQSWFTDDLLQDSIPLAVALCALGKGYSVSDANKIYRNGLMQIYGGNDIIDAMWTIANVGQIYDKLKSELENEGLDTSSFMKTATYGVQDWILKHVTRWVSPMGYTQFADMKHNGEFRRDFRYRLTEDGKEEYRDDMTILGPEILINKYACRSDILAAIANFFAGEEKYGWDASGYEYDQDELSRECARKRSLDAWLADDAFADVDKEFAQDLWCQETMNLINSYEDPQELFENEGFLLYADDAWILHDWAMSSAQKYKDALQNAQKLYDSNSITKNQYWSYKNYIDSEAQPYWDLVDKIGYGGLIYDDKAYKVVVGTQVENPTTGEYYNYGETYNSFSMFQTPDTGTIKFRKIYDEPTDTDGNYGDYRTESYRNDGATAYQRHDIPNENNRQIQMLRATIKENKEAWKDNNYSSYSANGSSEPSGKMHFGKSEDYSNDPIAQKERLNRIVEIDVPEFEAPVSELYSLWKDGENGEGGVNPKDIYSFIKNNMGQNPGSNGYGSSSYRSSGSSSYSGGYNYAPKIYSYSKGTLSVAKPSTMYSKTPYGTTRRYLTPTVYTSGSSAPYSRRES